ncbi:hypothetical protein Taro_054205 [Colocasia esculenta]|uniref:Uncharacterized protein n=1 Tax=Colocasia esculenta TaxID=4460 RepID=A0A843XPW4_COLES|nr:hypothetical protein [Colocasia esculenta]
MKQIWIRVSCSGVSMAVPKGKAAPPAASSLDASCKVELRIKIWKWGISLVARPHMNPRPHLNSNPTSLLCQSASLNI